MLKYILRLIYISTLVLLSSLSIAQAQQEHFGLENLVYEVKSALLKVETDAYLRNIPSLESVVLTAKTHQELAGGGEINFYILELGGGADSSATTTVVLTLRPPPLDSAADVSSKELADALFNAIIGASQAIAVAGRGEPPLVVADLEVTVSFGLVRKANGGFKIVFPPFKVASGGTINKSEIQSIKVKFKQ